MNARTSTILGALPTLALTVLLTACSSNENAGPTTPVFEAGSGTGGSTGTGGSGVDDSGTDGTPGTGGAGGNDGGVDAPADVKLDVDVDACSGDGGCWSCQPIEQDQFLNHCTDSRCQAYDNVAHLGQAYATKGDLPALPQ